MSAERAALAARVVRTASRAHLLVGVDVPLVVGAGQAPFGQRRGSTWKTKVWIEISTMLAK